MTDTLWVRWSSPLVNPMLLPKKSPVRSVKPRRPRRRPVGPPPAPRRALWGHNQPQPMPAAVQYHVPWCWWEEIPKDPTKKVLLVQEKSFLTQPKIQMKKMHEKSMIDMQIVWSMILNLCARNESGITEPRGALKCLLEAPMTMKTVQVDGCRNLRS